MNTSCQVGPCQQLPEFGSLQICAITAECLEPGATCGPPVKPLPAVGVMLSVCNPPADAASDAEGGPDVDTSVPPEASLTKDAADDASEDGAPGDGAPAAEGGDP